MLPSFCKDLALHLGSMDFSGGSEFGQGADGVAFGATNRDTCAERRKGSILIVLHQESSTPGRVGQVLRDRGHRLEVRRPALGEPLPSDLSPYAGLVVFGGPMSANDPDGFIAQEIALMERALRVGLPTLGICLGAQMLVRALGGRVAARDDGAVEIGWYPLHATRAGQQLIAEWPTSVYQWHSEGFDLPRGAELLASAELYPNQAFRVGSAIGIQFHGELTHAMMCKWTVKGAAKLCLPHAQDRRQHLAGRLRHDQALYAWLQALLMERFGVAQRA